MTVPGLGKTTWKSLTGAGLLLAAIVLLVVLARRMADMGGPPRAKPRQEDGILVPKAMPETREFPAESQPAAAADDTLPLSSEGPDKH